MNRTDNCHIVADGRDRAVAAIRAEVVAEFADKLAAASFWKRLLIWRAINSEVRRRCELQAPGRALYARQ